MDMFKYVLKRLALMLVIAFVIMTICFVLIKMLEPEIPMLGIQAEIEMAKREALGYNKPILVQYGIYLKNIITEWNWGWSWKVDYMKPVTEVIAKRIPPTLILNFLSMILSIPFGILLGIVAALHKNTALDHFISTAVMVVVSVPAFVYGFLLQYFFAFKWGLLPMVVSSLRDAGGSWMSWTMIRSMILPILSLSFGTIAGMARFTRAELCEALTSEYMLLARTKGLTKGQAVRRHAMKNAMVPILPSIIASFTSILGGAIITEKIFSIVGMGSLQIAAISMLDYDLFVATSVFYTLIGLLGTLIVDLSYGFLDPRIKMGAR
ncbi:MAG: ABC transporter permease [Eubacteriales bacterium]|nr:ABC transporter permease [Eubacteriales bacterium]